MLILLLTDRRIINLYILDIFKSIKEDFYIFYLKPIFISLIIKSIMENSIVQNMTLD